MKLVASHGNHIFLVVKDAILGVNVHPVVPSVPSPEAKEYRSELSKGSQILGITTNSKGTELYAIYDSKLMVAWDIASRAVLGSRVLKKRPTSLVAVDLPFDDHSSKSAILIADKIGDLIALRTPGLDAELTLGGHTASVVTDIAVSADSRLFASADRDGKFRISSFPAVETVLSYALGHKSVVSSLSTVTLGQQVHVISSSWDHQVCLWKAVPGPMAPLDRFSCTAPVAFTEEVEEEEVQAQGEQEEGDDEEAEGDAEAAYEKKFVESDAGHYPFKVISTNLTAEAALVAVIYREEHMVKLLRVEGGRMTESGQIDLIAPPADILFLDNRQLLVLGPQPCNVQVFQLTGDAVQEVSKEVLGDAQLTMLRDLADADYTQALVAGAMGFDGDSGMRKHALDNKFNKEDDIDYSARKGSKRSKKRKV